MVFSDLSTFELWHRRMGHPSDKVLKLVTAVKNSTSSEKKKLTKAFVVCPQAKQPVTVFLLVIARLVEFLNLFIVIYGGQIKFLLLV
ncbi:GAG-pre-integrase domain-containing protein, partial [Pseudomonas syringae]|uniref:GAG-pre-integrase domain-containing protein n=1 Tax=Pseudomonas syringae TaxID=317 RepID=UPI0034D9620B